MAWQDPNKVPIKAFYEGVTNVPWQQVGTRHPKAAKVSQLAHLFPWMLGTVPSFEVNYMSTLSFDRHPAVRRFWFETLSHWMLRCVDKAEKKNLYW